MERKNVQGLVLAPYRYRRARHLFFELQGERGSGRPLIRALLPYITHGETFATNPGPAWLCNISFTGDGLKQIGCDPQLISSLDANFLEGPSPVTLGDVDNTSSDRETWWDGHWKTYQIHLV